MYKCKQMNKLKMGKKYDSDNKLGLCVIKILVELVINFMGIVLAMFALLTLV